MTTPALSPLCSETCSDPVSNTDKEHPSEISPAAQPDADSAATETLFGFEAMATLTSPGAGLTPPHTPASSSKCCSFQSGADTASCLGGLAWGIITYPVRLAASICCCATSVACCPCLTAAAVKK